MALLPDQAGLPDAANPRAVAYAHSQLKRMVKLGLIPKHYGVPGEDVTATYRRLSGALGGRQHAVAAAAPAGDVGGMLGQLAGTYQPGGPMQRPAPAATNPLEAAAAAQAGASIPQPPAAVGPMGGAAQAQPPQTPAAVGPMVASAMPRQPGQHPTHAAIQALMAAIRPQQHGPVNARQQLIAHLAQRIRAQTSRGPYIQNFGGPGY